MNYRHAYHAGNFADVAKHALLALLIERLKVKDSAFRVIDTHAGIGRYRLSEGPSAKTGEWREGIMRLLAATPRKEINALLAPYLGAVRAANLEGGLEVYPGSPRIVRHLLRRQDRMTVVELHPEDAARLAEEFAGDRQVKVVALDGWQALIAFVPPKERRGIVLIDPPYEQDGEFERLAGAFAKAYRRWPTGIYALWYPIKDREAVRAFLDRLKASGIPRLIAAEMTIRPPSGMLDGCGMVFANPPWNFASDAEVLLEGLAEILELERGGGDGRVEILRGE